MKEKELPLIIELLKFCQHKNGNFHHKYMVKVNHVTSSPAHTPEPSQIWVHLHPLSNNKFILPHYTENTRENRNVNRHLWLTRLIGFGSTGNVWQCYFDNSDGFFATKVVELLRKSDIECQQQFSQEFGVYLTLETAYQSGQLCDRVAPHCYGAFRGDGVNVLILELCSGTLKGWGELDISECDYSHFFCRTQLYLLGESGEPSSCSKCSELQALWSALNLPEGQSRSMLTLHQLTSSLANLDANITKSQLEVDGKVKGDARVVRGGHVPVTAVRSQVRVSSKAEGIPQGLQREDKEAESEAFATA
ncbi:hypothetical protein EDB89DRAFT_2249172 [Lactarius sanguifluus]|nr:hypothetical protein EDB89DRAFT_2249172 [Lactarius sanguifluus]